MTLERAILFIVGIIVLGSVVLGLYHSPNWFWVTALMGLHLIQASFTSVCPVVMTLRAIGFKEVAEFKA